MLPVAGLPDTIFLPLSPCSLSLPLSPLFLPLTFSLCLSLFPFTLSPPSLSPFCASPLFSPPSLSPLFLSAEKHFLRGSRPGDVPSKNPVVRSKSYNTPLLNPVAEHEAEGAAAGGSGVRRHSVSEMTSCPDPQGFGDSPTSPCPEGPGPGGLYPDGSPASSPENLLDHILESVDSDAGGIFIDFGRGGRSDTAELGGSGDQQSVL